MVEKGTESSLTSGAVLAHYKIEKLLGRGGMGEVYLAHDLRLKRQVALKILPEEFAADAQRLARFRREATAAAALNHPNICTIHEVGESEGLTYICMEYVEGTTLKECLEKEPLPVDRVVDIGLHLADALELARQKGIVHRDIESQNIILTPAGQPKILDFGLAKNLPTLKMEGGALADVTASLTSADVSQIGMILGTASSMSPEQALGLDVDHRSDLFSLGVVLFEMLTGRLPFEGRTVQEVLPKVLYENTPRIETLRKDVPEALSRLVEKLLAKKKEDRFQTAKEVLETLRSIKDEIVSGIVLRKARPRLLKKMIWPVVGVLAAFVLFLFLIIGPGRKGIVPSAEAVSLTALPSQVFGPAEYAYLTDAVPSTLSTYLGQIEGLDVKVPPTSIEVEKVQGDLAKIAGAYKVKYFVKTSITVDSGSFVLNVQMMDAKTHSLVWSKPCEGSLKIYREVCRQVADDIRNKLRPSASPLGAVVGSANASEAELAFRRGQYYSNRYNNLHEPSDFEEALTDFKKVLDLDPKMADAAAEIAMLFVFKIESRASPPRDAIPEIESWTRRALQINERSSKGWTAMTAMETYKPRGNMNKSLEFSLKAAFFGPEDAMAQLSLGLMFSISGPLYLSLPTFIESGRLDPLYTMPFLGAAGALLFSGRDEEALYYLDKSFSIEPESSMGLFQKAHHFIYLGRLKESTELMKKIEKAVVENKLQRFVFILLSQLQSLQTGDKKSAETALAEALKIVESPEISYFDLNNYTFDFPPILVRQGKKEAAMRILEKGIDAQAVAYDFLRLNPDLQKLKGEPRFERLLDRTKTQFKVILKIIDQARTRGEFPRYLEKPLAELIDKLGLR